MADQYLAKVDEKDVLDPKLQIKYLKRVKALYPNKAEEAMVGEKNLGEAALKKLQEVHFFVCRIKFHF